jgi:hypothetical protein
VGKEGEAMRKDVPLLRLLSSGLCFALPLPSSSLKMGRIKKNNNKK